MRKMRCFFLSPNIGLLALWLTPVSAGSQIVERRRSAVTVPDTLRPPSSTSALEARLSRILVREGFANVVVSVQSQVVVRYENARFRNPEEAMSRAVDLLRPEIAADQELALVPTLLAVPLLAAHYTPGFSFDSTFAPVATKASLGLSGLAPDASRLPHSSSSFGRIDVVLHPWFEASFGNYANTTASRTGIAPKLRVALCRRPTAAVCSSPRWCRSSAPAWRGPGP